MGDLLILGQVALAMILGALVGLDREFADKPAGLRTHMLVGGAAALLINVADLAFQQFGRGAGTFQYDPLRIIGAVVTGVSFLGAGTIIRRRANGSAEEEVEGLTTAASLLFVAAIGIYAGLAHVWLAVGATALALVTVTGLKAVEQWFDRRRKNAATQAEKE